MSKTQISRRHVLTLCAGIGVTFLANPTFALTAMAKRKLVVIVCRGAMDGLSVAVPIDDKNYPNLRGDIVIPAKDTLKLDSDFGLHPKLDGLYALAKAGQARIAPAVAIPERIRSHFEAQDLLESGGAHLYSVSTGWLNRTLLSLAPGSATSALSVGAQEPLILRGKAQVQSWSPGGRMTDEMDRIATVLQDLYKSDPLLGPAFASGLSTEMTAEELGGDQTFQPRAVKKFATTTAKFLTKEGGPSIAVFSLDGFDTHANQGSSDGQLAIRLKLLDDVITGLHEGLGNVWKDTVLIAVTEFGRTARVNGTRGTDHGTASTMILAGGALKKGGIIGDWPTLADSKLFENRDLAPTLDVRQVFKSVLADHIGVDRKALETTIFPDSLTMAAVSGLVA